MTVLPVGSFFRVKHPDYPQFDREFKIIARNHYYSEGEIWYEYEFLFGEKELFLEVEEDCFYFSLKQIKPREVGLRSFWFKPPNQLAYGGKTFPMVEKGKAKFFEGEDKIAELFEYYDYRNEREHITVEHWEDGDLEIFLSLKLSIEHLNY
ncbi:MAG: DUF4178 domain-containing protein [Cytophagales bacterium]|nr:DUF4178 domain-containing protein [Cytophagales bacterium]